MQNLNDSPSPLSRLINDDNLTILENIIPHCNANLGKFLALCLKISEMQKITLRILHLYFVLSVIPSPKKKPIKLITSCKF